MKTLQNTFNTSTKITSRVFSSLEVIFASRDDFKKLSQKMLRVRRPTPFSLVFIKKFPQSRGKCPLELWCCKGHLAQSDLTLTLVDPILLQFRPLSTYFVGRTWLISSISTLQQCHCRLFSFWKRRVYFLRSGQDLYLGPFLEICVNASN